MLPLGVKELSIPKISPWGIQILAVQGAEDPCMGDHLTADIIWPFPDPALDYSRLPRESLTYISLAEQQIFSELQSFLVPLCSD